MHYIPDIDRLRAIKTLPQLIAYLRDELEWPIDQNAVEDDLTFEWAAEDLGLDAESAVKIREIKQLRPLQGDQPWGIFFINFEKKKLPVVVLRRLLNGLVIKKRASAQKGKQAVWRMSDLLFISAYGEAEQREISFAHFCTDSAGSGDLPTLRVLGWDGGDTPLKLEHVAATLHEKLRWPDQPQDHDAWRAQWAGAFRHRLGHVIRTADMLAEVLAVLARGIRARCTVLMSAETERGLLTKLYKAFQAALIHDLTAESFADTYAQTITYGLLTAAINRTDMSGGREGTYVKADDLTLMVRVTSPFLKEMLQTFLTAGGRKNGVDFDELGIQDVVELLRGDETDLPEILRNFGDRKPGEDPVIHFYEHFLSAYNKRLRVQRGVFYTPQPVVSYIVRSVHELLQTEFGLEDGLADTTTWGEMVKRHPGLKLPPLSDEPGDQRAISPDEPFVQVLDPATGTATFLVEVIEVICQHLQAKWEKHGLQGMPIIRHTALRLPQFKDYWNVYVPLSLLPRLHGYELLAAPYAIAHLKIGLKLTETGYQFGSDERARIYLTNALEPKVTQLPQVGFDALAHEAATVNEIKWYKRFTVVIGNPPYSRSCSNKGAFIEHLMESYKSAVRDERNIQPLSDDYIKFIRFSEYLLNTSRVGIHGMITNNTFLSGRIHRGMRASLLKLFPRALLLNLHGSGNVDFLGTQGQVDENVFDILQGVSVSVLSTMASKPQLLYAELVGPRRTKYELLDSGNVSDWKTLEPVKPYFLLIPRSSNVGCEYERYLSLGNLFRFYSVSGKPGDDPLLVSIEKDEVLPKLQEFRRALSSGEIKKLTEAGRNLAARQHNKAFNSDFVIPYAYRPFDLRYTYYDVDVWTRAVRPLKACVDGAPILLTTKIVKDPSFSHVFVSRIFADVIYLSNTSSVNCYSFPSKCSEDRLTLCFSNRGLDYNLDIAAFTLKIGNSVTHDDAFNYIYALLHSPRYRELYFEFLQYDFPRLPLTGNLELFRTLARLGGALVALHLLESPKLDKPITEFIGGRNPEVEKVSWSKNTVWLDKAQTIGFKGVREEVWNFHIGGYQVCEKWLKDRKGRTLLPADIAHYQRIVVALAETIRLMKEIDKVIEEHGGWPLK